MSSRTEDAWEIVHRAGVPLAGPRVGPPPSERAIADAVHTLVLSASAPTMTHREREAVGAFVLAWSDHFHRSYAAAFGDDTTRLSAWAESVTLDANRRIKLRRIALESLSTVL